MRGSMESSSGGNPKVPGRGGGRLTPKQPPAKPVHRTGGAYKLVTAFKILDISPSFGYELIKTGKLRTVRLGPGSPRITDAEIERVLAEGIE